MPRIEVPEYNTAVTFPDDMPQEQMQSILAKQFPKKVSFSAKTKDVLGQFGDLVTKPVQIAGSGFAGLGAMAGSLSAGSDLDTALNAGSEASGRFMDAATLKPETEAGKKFTKTVMKPFEMWSEAGDYMVPSEGPGLNPNLQAVKRASWELAPFLLGVRKNTLDYTRGGKVSTDVPIPPAERSFRGNNPEVTPAVRPLIRNPEELSALTDVERVQPRQVQTVRDAENAPPMLQNRMPQGIEGQGQGEAATRLAYEGVEQLMSPRRDVLTANPETLPFATDLSTVRPNVQPERPSEVSPSRVTESPSLENIPRADHEQLSGPTVVDATTSSTLPPSVKPVVKGTLDEISNMPSGKGKVKFTIGDVGYVIDADAVHGIIKAETKAKSVTEAKRRLKQGGDAESELLGYPKREGLDKSQTIDVAVTKDGRVVTDINEISTEANNGNVVYAAEGKPAEAAAAADTVAKAVAKDRPQGETLDINIVPGLRQVVNLIDHHFRKLPRTAPPGSMKEWFDRNRAANEKFGNEPLRNSLKRALLGGAENVGDALDKLGPRGEAVRRQFNAVSGATGIVEERVRSQRENIIGGFLDGLSIRQEQAMADLIALDRDLSISQYKGGNTGNAYTFIGGKTPQELAAARRDFARDYGFTPAEMQQLETSVSRYFDEYRALTARMEAEGLIDATQKAALDRYDYSPKQFLEKIDPNMTNFDKYGGKITVPDSGIKRLKEGSDSYFRNNPMQLLAEATARAETRIAKNKANTMLADLATTVPNNGIVQTAGRGTPPPGWESISYMDGGQQKTVWMNSEFAKEWTLTDPLLNSKLAEVMQWLTLVKPLRAAATGYNPAFAVSNIPIDLVTIWMQAEPKGFSQHAPVALYQTARNLAKVSKDAWTRKGRYQDYVNEGGGRERLTQQGLLVGRRYRLFPMASKVQTALSYINNWSEVVTRLAYREQLIKNGIQPETASKIAADYLDFSKGGTAVKAIDKMGIPYLNAAVQGTRSMWKSLSKDPAKFAYKTGQLMLGVSALYVYNMETNPEGLRNVSPREKANNFIIMLPKSFSYTDKDGNERDLYLKIRKEQFVQPFLTGMELAMAKMYQEKVDAKQMKMSVTQAVPVGMDRLPPVLSAYQAYANNVNTFMGEPAWKGREDIEPYAEYTNNTNPMMKQLGQVGTYTDDQGIKRGGISPTRAQVAFNQVVPLSNAYVQGSGSLLTAMYEQMNPQDKIEFQKTNVELLKSIPGVSRLIGTAPSTGEFREKIKESRRGEATQDFEANKKIDLMVTKYLKEGASDEEQYARIVNFIESQPEQEQERLVKRVNSLVETVNLPDRGWWLSMKSLPPEQRAEEFVRRLKTEPRDVQEKMVETANTLKGFVSDRFMNRYSEVMK